MPVPDRRGSTTTPDYEHMPDGDWEHRGRAYTVGYLRGILKAGTEQRSQGS